MLWLLLACRTDVKDVAPPVVDEDLLMDSDGDGYTSDEDCDDADPTINPGMNEVCDGLDNNCNDSTDEGVLQTYYIDVDDDGYGSDAVSTEACEPPDGFVPNGTDCDDADPNSHPSAEEVCDEVDNDCNGDIDEDLGEDFFADHDGDGFGNDNEIIRSCELETGLSSIGGDCNDQDYTINPIATEICDEVDNDCNDAVDDGVGETYFLDADGDGYGDSSVSIVGCTVPSGYAAVAQDCDDGDPLINPNATEVCDSEDNNCDGTIDEGAANTFSVFYRDSDGDGFGDINETIIACAQPTGYVSNYDDCDDDNASVTTVSTEVCDGLDNDCDGQVDEPSATDSMFLYVDSDGDGFGDPLSGEMACPGVGYTTDGNDCNDADATISYCLDCNEILANGLDSGNGLYDIDPSNTGNPYPVYCDMTSEGGGWTLVARQIPSLGLTDTTLDINTGAGWNENSTFRYGNNKIQQYSPTQAWRITSVDGSGTLVDNAWFSPSCVIDWGEYVGIWGSSTVFDSACGIAYTSSSLTTVVGGNYTTNACSLGIGQNNGGGYCSIRMGSCAYGPVAQGMASPCSINNTTTHTISLWVK